MIPIRFEWLIVGAWFMALCACHPRSATLTRDQSVEIAKDTMVGLSARMRDHVRIDRNNINVTDAVQLEDKGWNVSLAHGGCQYIVYVGPLGDGVDVAGKNRECDAPASASAPASDR